MLKIETDLIKLEYDDKLNEITADLIADVMNKVYSSRGIPVESFDSNKYESDIKLLSDEKHYDGIKPEEPIEIDLKKVSLPRCVTTLTCPSCKQSFLMKIKETGDMLFKNYNDNKLYNLGDIKLPALPKSGKARLGKLKSIYNDCLELCSPTKSYKFISDSEDMLICPFCGQELSIKDMVEFYSTEHIDDKCFICGSETETVMNKTANMVRKCIENNCLEPII